MVKLNITTEMEEINEFFKEIKFYYVGGCVRDLIKGEAPKDYDLITPLTPDKIEEHIKSKGKRVWRQGAKYGTLGVKINNEIVEITTYRKEQYTKNNRKPKVEYTTQLQEDLQRRDFTINSLVCDSKGKIKDFFGGLQDIEDNILRCVGNSKQRFKEDPLRILRGIRFVVKYGMDVEEKTDKRLESCRWELLNISKERIIDEINKIMLIVSGVGPLFYYKTLQVIIPELYLQKDYEQNNPHHRFALHDHTMLIVDYVMRNYKEPKYLWSALLHDIAKPFVAELHKSGERTNYINHDVLGAVMAEDFCRKYKFSNEDREFIVESVKNHIKEDSWLKPFDNASK